MVFSLRFVFLKARIAFNTGIKLGCRNSRLIREKAQKGPLWYIFLKAGIHSFEFINRSEKRIYMRTFQDNTKFALILIEIKSMILHDLEELYSKYFIYGFS